LLCFGFLLNAYLLQAQTRSPIGASATETVGDSKLYIKIYGSYGLSTQGSYRAFDINSIGFPILYGGISVAPVGNNLRYQSLSQGLGQGFRVGGGLGLVISDFINLGIDADYYRSGQVNVLSFSTIGGGKVINSSDMEASMITILPNITFKALSKPSFFVYMRLGIGLGIPDVKQDFVNTLNGKLSSSQNFAFKGGMAYGYLVSLGVQKRLSSQLRAFAEAQLINFSYSPRQRITTAWLDDAVINNDEVTVAPKDVLADRDRSEKEIEYYDDYTTTATQDIAKPLKSGRLTMPFSSLGLQIGLTYRF